MRLLRSNSRSGTSASGSLGSRGGFSLAELMVAIAIMGIIVYALYSVFNQTQKALRSAETQGDVFEKGRAIMEMVTRELEQAVATQSPFEFNVAGGLDLPPHVQTDSRAETSPLNAATPRTNMLHNLYLLNRLTNTWTGIGYRLANAESGAGTLMRWSSNVFWSRPVSNHLRSAFLTERFDSTNYHHVAEGIVHFRTVAYDPNGLRMGYETTNRYPGVYTILRRDSEGTENRAKSDFGATTNTATVFLDEALDDPNARRETRYFFRSNALPAYIDFELGILEPESWKVYRQMMEDGNTNGASSFLGQRVNKVHLFRQRIPIRTAAK